MSLILLAGCNKDIQNQDAVRQGVMSYLSKRSDLLAMDVSVVMRWRFNEDEATAQVHFQAKGNSSPAAGMTMQYVLERKDGQWVVKGRTGANSSHGASGPGVNASAWPGKTARGAGWNAARSRLRRQRDPAFAAWTSRRQSRFDQSAKVRIPE